MEVSGQPPEENKCQNTEHGGETIKFYCRSHSTFGCGSCMTIDHHDCDKPVIIEEEYKNFEAKVNKLNGLLQHHSEKREQNSTAHKSNHSKVVKDIKHFMKDVKEHFEKLETAMITEADKLQDDDEQKMNDISDTCTTMRNDLQTLTSNLSKLHQTKQNENLFTMMEDTNDQMETIVKTIHKMNRENTVQLYSFKPEKKIKSTISKVSAIGKLVLENKQNDEPQNDILRTSEDNLTSDKAMASKSNILTKTGARQQSTSQTCSQVTPTTIKQEEPTTSTAPENKRKKQTDVKTRSSKIRKLGETITSENTQAIETAQENTRRENDDVRTTRASKKSKKVTFETQDNSLPTGPSTSDTAGNIQQFPFTPRKTTRASNKTKLEESITSENTQAIETAQENTRRDNEDVKTTRASKKSKKVKSETQANSSAIEPSTSDTAGNVTEFPFTPRQASKIFDINVKSPTDKDEASVIGLALLPNGKLILADDNNLKVKLINIKQNRIITELKLSSDPFDITVVSDNQVAVTMPNANQIQFMSISNQKISLSQIIKVKGECTGIVHNNGTLLVTFINPDKVEMISMSGSVLRVIDKGTNGEPLFIQPEYIALSLDRTHVYISDLGKKTVTRMTLDGEVKGVYSDKDLKFPHSVYRGEGFECPCGLTVDKTGSVYVACGFSCYIYQISGDCSQGQELQGGRQGLLYTRSIAYCHKEDKLYVGDETDTIKVFALK